MLLISTESFDILESEYISSLENEVVSDKLWLILWELTGNYLKVNYKYNRFGKEFCESTQLKCQERLLKYIFKFSLEKAKKAYTKHDRKLPDLRDMLLIYFTKIIWSTVLNNLGTFFNRQNKAKEVEEIISAVSAALKVNELTDSNNLIDYNWEDQYKEVEERLDNEYLNRIENMSDEEIDKRLNNGK